MKYKGVKLPKCNGRPQLWARGYGAVAGTHTTLRIIYPNGKVEFNQRSLGGFLRSKYWKGGKGCTSSDTQLQALKNTIKYDLHSGEAPWFLGYL